MYITVNDIIGEKRIDLAYPIQDEEVAVVIMLSDNVQYWLKGSMKILLKLSEKIALTKGVYTDKELNALIGLELKSQMVSCDDVLRETSWKMSQRWSLAWTNSIIPITSKMEIPATPYLHTMCLVLNILGVLNQRPHSTRSLKVVIFSL